MKTIKIISSGILFFFLAVSVSCGGAKSCNQKLANKDCPPDGKCSVTVHKGKALAISTDEFGKPHYELKDDNAKNVVIYHYKREVPEGVQDGSYREEVILELDKNQQSASLGANVKTGPKALFGRFCYCKGSTGYYPISGKLTLSNSEDQEYVLEFKTTEVPQVLQKIQFSTK